MTNTLPRIASNGSAIHNARAVAIMVHGRSGTAEDILTLGQDIGAPDIAYIAPQAPGGTWYPRSFLAPIGDNEPYLTHSLELIGDVVHDLKSRGVPSERIVLIGFSQGACLALEYVARNAERYGGVAGLSGGLIGPRVTAAKYKGSLFDTPVFLGCSDVDFHIPLDRVRETSAVLQSMGAKVTERIYPGMPHTIIEDEVEFVRSMLANIPSRSKDESHAA
jgi:phospholipase/carboxylesterase